MRSIKIGLALMAALVFSVAMTASASATGFLATKLESLLSTKVAKQIFKTNAGTVECTEAKIEKGTSNDNGEQSSQLAEIHYSSCLAFGFVPSTLTNADYNFLASGTAHINSLILIVAEGCEVSVPAQSVSEVLYKTEGNNILLTPHVTGILYTAAKCISGNGEAKNGTYTGSSEVMIAGGTLSFMP